MQPKHSGNTGDDLGLSGKEHFIGGNSIVSISGKLPNCFEVPTSKLLDVLMAFSQTVQGSDRREQRRLRGVLNQKLFTRTRPGFYMEVGDVLHFAYMGQPNGAGSQHWWRIFCTDERKPQISALLGILPPPEAEKGASGNFTTEWGGLYLRSEAEVRIAKALDQTGLLFFANTRGRVRLQDTSVSDTQLTGRVEADFMVFYQGRCFILEVDGKHHSEEGQSIRDYARDRVLLAHGIPTVRFTARDCLERPYDVASEFAAILKAWSG